MSTAYQLPLAVAPILAFTQIAVNQGNVLLSEWDHYLGPANRPFGMQAWALEVDSQPIAVAISASTVSATAAGLERTTVVELARLCSHPAHRWATRPTLRLWREIAGPRWPYWRAVAAVAYSQNARHGGAIYRFDGWRRVTDNCGRSAGAGTWTKPRPTGERSRGRKSLWIWNYPTDEEIIA